MSRLHAIAATCGGLWMAAGVAACATAWAAADLTVRVETTAGTTLEGGLKAIDRDGLDLLVDGESRRIELAGARSLTVAADPTDAAGPPPAVEVFGDRGLAFGGDDFRWEDGRAAVVRGDDAIDLPIERVRRAVWRSPADAGGDWLAAVPAEPAADLVAVSATEGFELVECAITGVSPATVTVILDGERIPVSRRKVLGLVWARPAAVETSGMAPATPVVIDGGAVAATTVEWRDSELVLDGEIRVPGRLLRSIDFAAGRTVPLVAIEPEASSGEPFFGGLAGIDGLAAFFAPRIVDPDDGRPAWLMRPHATATWRIPEGSRRFRGRAVLGGAASAPEVVVWARADDGPEWRQRLDGPAAAAIEVDVRAARRLTIGVEFGPGGVGVPVRLVDAGFEK